jgi:ABC-type spermidine/putrescine transport system permease subunit II
MRLPRLAFFSLNAVALFLAMLLIWPLLQMVLSSLTTDINFPPRNFSLDAFRQVMWKGYLQALWYSLELAFWVTLLLLVICLPAAYALERKRFPGRSLLSVIIFVPTIFPSVTYVSAIGIYVAIFFSQWRGAFPIIVLGTAMSGIPLVVRALQASLAMTDPIYEEAAQVMGARPLNAFRKVTLPLIGPGLVTAAMIAFASSAMAFIPPYILGTKQPTVSLYVFRDLGKIGFTPTLALQILVMELVILAFVQVLYFVFRKQFRGLFI